LCIQTFFEGSISIAVFIDSIDGRNHFIDNLRPQNLVVVRDDRDGDLLGAYDLDSLLREIFKQRLEKEGGQVLATAENANASLAIQLKEFKLDIVDRKWTLQMSYQAGLSKNKGIFAKESVSGSAERLKVMGKTDAEKILGELVTDMVNKLDVARLFEKTQ
jgi:hypothetical protein